jgi:hypothetical protein
MFRYAYALPCSRVLIKSSIFYLDVSQYQPELISRYVYFWDIIVEVYYIALWWVVAVSGSPHIRRRNDGSARADGEEFGFLLIT